MTTTRRSAPPLLWVAGVSAVMVFLLPAPRGAAAEGAGGLPAPLREGGSSSLVALPLQDLSPAATTFLATRAGTVGVAVDVPGSHAFFVSGSDDRFPLASICKLAIMLTLLHRTQQQRRRRTQLESTELQAMIERSDNDAATALWKSVGGGTAVQQYLASIGVSGFEPGAGEDWGASTDTAGDIARMLAALADGSILDASDRDLALVLMSRIEPSQRWGVSTGVPSGSLLAFKNGWVESSDGTWLLHSAGIVVPGQVSRAYTIVVLTNHQPTLQYGVQTIEHVATLLHADLAPAP